MWLDSCESSISQMSFSLFQGNILPTRAASHFLQIWWRCVIFSNRDTFQVSGNDLWLKQQDCRAHFYISRCRFFKKENMTAKNNNKNPPKLRNMQTSVCILRWEDRDEVKLAHWSSVGRMPHTWSAEAVIQAPCRWTQHFLCFVPVQVCQIGAFIWIWRSVVFFSPVKFCKL